MEIKEKIMELVSRSQSETLLELVCRFARRILG